MWGIYKVIVEANGTVQLRRDAYFSGDDGVSERLLPLAGWASLRERSAPFEVPPDAG